MRGVIVDAVIHRQFLSQLSREKSRMRHHEPRQAAAHAHRPDCTTDRPAPEGAIQQRDTGHLAQGNLRDCAVPELRCDARRLCAESGRAYGTSGAHRGRLRAARASQANRRRAPCNAQPVVARCDDCSCGFRQTIHCRNRRCRTRSGHWMHRAFRPPLPRARQARSAAADSPRMRRPTVCLARRTNPCGCPESLRAPPRRAPARARTP